MIRYILVFAGVLFLFSCGAKTTVILLPEQDNKAGTVIVANDKSSTTLEKPYSCATVGKVQSRIDTKTVEKNKVQDEYKTLFQAEPLKPVSLLLYFEFGSDRLQPESAALIDDVLKLAKEREPSEVSIIGHSDSKGNADYNYQLALERAKVVEKIIKDANINLRNISVTSHGENDPLVITGDNVSEEKNRRVEIMVK
ncbi:OmpA family protein [uncultured Desulfobacter sp.]|uniref:OmpA family protein n=1 Tax=uncultured Desulfobacter sp. TaxID=240139 RepID=UPI0029F5CC1B|nr:OmpA family protein [uncultured Desulfobacter sp.]